MGVRALSATWHRQRCSASLRELLPPQPQGELRVHPPPQGHKDRQCTHSHGGKGFMAQPRTAPFHPTFTFPLRRHPLFNLFLLSLVGKTWISQSLKYLSG